MLIETQESLAIRKRIQVVVLQATITTEGSHYEGSHYSDCCCIQYNLDDCGREYSSFLIDSPRRPILKADTQRLVPIGFEFDYQGYRWKVTSSYGDSPILGRATFRLEAICLTAT